MSHFKKFSDLVGGIGAFFASVFLLGKYMEYEGCRISEKRIIYIVIGVFALLTCAVYIMLGRG